MYGTSVALAVKALPRMAVLDGYPEPTVRARLGDELVDAALRLGWLRRVDGGLEISTKGWRAIEGRGRAAVFLLRHPARDR